MTHWMEGDWPETDSDGEDCHHGNKPHECNDCMIESDFAYDADRESWKPSRRDDEPGNSDAL